MAPAGSETGPPPEAKAAPSCLSVLPRLSGVVRASPRSGRWKQTAEASSPAIPDSQQCTAALLEGSAPHAHVS